jgi:hypothetical protein
MTLKTLSLAVIGTVIFSELAINSWNHFALTPSTSGYFSWPQAAAAFDKSNNLDLTIELYRCDRAANHNIITADGQDITSVYLEWDRIEAGPAMGFAAHETEICNTALGYRLLKVLPERILEGPYGDKIRFDATHFLNPMGRDVFMFKTAWVQGAGSWQLRDQETRRFERLRRSFHRSNGVGRMVLSAVFDVPDIDTAWDVFNREVTSQFVWTPPRED